MTNTTQILNQYSTLITYCDTFFVRVSSAYPSHMACKPGCSSCCILQTVCALEAAVVSWEFSRLQSDGAVAEETSASCPLLHRNRCTIYRARPLICRTHGLLLGRFDNGVLTGRHSCDLNFPLCAEDEVPAKDVFDEARITMNLMKLNLAWCMLHGREDLAQRRIALRDIVQGTYGAQISPIPDPRSQP